MRKEENSIDRVHQKHITYGVTMTEHTGYGGAFILYRTIRNTPHEYGGIIEYIGTYKEYNSDYIYDPDRVTVSLTMKFLDDETKAFCFDGSHDVLIGNKIEIDGEEHAVIDKKYQLDGTIDYYVEDKFIKCENYEEEYKKVKSEAGTYLLSKRELEDEHRKQRFETKPDKKKSIWWYFGIR